MTISPDVRSRIKLAVEHSKSFYTMNREQIFLYLADIAALSDTLADTLCDIEKGIGNIELQVQAAHADEKCTATMLKGYIKSATAEQTADRDWAKNQLSLLNSLRIAALAAQRSAE